MSQSVNKFNSDLLNNLRTFLGAVFDENINSWVHYNDTQVSLKKSLLDIVDCQPYILFYKKIESMFKFCY